MTKLTILGGGLSAVSLAYYLQDKENINEINILEMDDKLGGLARSYNVNGIAYDVGPHIIFSKNKEILDLMNNLLGDNLNKIRRSNIVLHDKRFVVYPFENDLSKLSDTDKNYCTNAFINNPYENYETKNMLQFFLKTFGEGITNLYLRPYNEKIWKFDPSFMSTQMVDRIPKPPKEDIIKSAEGATVEGYVHQLYFTYPKEGGIQSLFNAFVGKLKSNVKCHTNHKVLSVKKENGMFKVETSSGSFLSEKLISTMPIDKFVDIYQNEKPKEVIEAKNKLKYNSIAITVVNVNKDKAKDNFAFMIADKDVIFHRISKLDFMGENYNIKDTATYLVEVTYRKNDVIDNMNDKELLEHITSGLIKIGFIDSASDINFSETRHFEYAYVIYDLFHKENMDTIKAYFKEQGIILAGRFGSFEYMNMDAVIEQSLNISKEI